MLNSPHEFCLRCDVDYNFFVRRCYLHPILLRKGFWCECNQNPGYYYQKKFHNKLLRDSVGQLKSIDQLNKQLC